jgi:hypothetical protein
MEKENTTVKNKALTAKMNLPFFYIVFSLNLILSFCTKFSFNFDAICRRVDSVSAAESCFAIFDVEIGFGLSFVRSKVPERIFAAFVATVERLAAKTSKEKSNLKKILKAK